MVRAWELQGNTPQIARTPCAVWQVTRLADEAYPALNELSAAVSTLKLKRVRGIKSRLVAVSARVQKVCGTPYVCHLKGMLGDVPYLPPAFHPTFLFFSPAGCPSPLTPSFLSWAGS